MGWLVAAVLVTLVGIGALVEVWYQRAARRAAAGRRTAQRAARRSPLRDRRPQDDLEGWR